MANRSSRKSLSAPRPWLAKCGTALLLSVIFEWYFFLLAPAFILLPSRNLSIRRIYRNYLSTLQLIFFGFVSFVFEIFFSVKLSVFGGEELLDRYLEKPFVIANHRTRLDWFFIVCVCLRLRRLSSVKIALKEDIRRIPIFGWGVQSFLFPGISRSNRELDMKRLKDCVEYHHLLALVTNHTQNCTVVIFPEGTDLSDSNVAKCNEYQTNKNLQITKQVLTPKVGGFAQVLETLKDCNAVDAMLDLTCGFVDFAPFERPDETAFLTGRFPKEVHVKIDVIDWRDLPGKESAGDFLNESFAKKENLLTAFYQPLTMYSEQSSVNEAVNALSLDGNQSDCSSTQLSNLEPVLQFVDPVTTEPLEETLTKDIRFVQYALNSFVIVVFLALMIHVAICFAVYSWPIHVLTYVLAVTAVSFLVTHVFGGFDRLEMEIFRPDFPDSSEHMYAQLMSHRAARRASPRRVRDSFWASLVHFLGLPGSSARRSAYIDSVRHRAALNKGKAD